MSELVYDPIKMNVQGAVITYMKIKVAMKRRHFSAMILNLSRKGLRVAQCLCMELTTEESKRREYKKRHAFLVQRDSRLTLSVRRVSSPWNFPWRRRLL